MLHITSYAHIKHNQIDVNGTFVFKTENQKPLVDFLSEAYKSIGISYPKFHKMDTQCKLGVLCTEFALQNKDFLTTHNLQKTAIVLSNSASSLDTDRQYQQSINDKQNYFPSPTLFVYTLPNIVIGEIAIKYKLTGENAFLVSEEFNTKQITEYAEMLMNDGTEAVVAGWVNVDDNAYEAFIFLIEKTHDTNKNGIFKPLNHLNVNTLYNQTTWTH